MSAPESKPTVQVTSRRNAALARRLAPGGNVFGGGSRSIPLKEPERWHTRIENDYGDDQQIYRSIHELGWEPLELSDLACKPEDVGLRVNESGHLVRGSHGREVVLKMAADDYKMVERLKTERNLQGVGSQAKTKAAMAEAAAASHGPEAGDFVHRHVTGSVIDTKGPL